MTSNAGLSSWPVRLAVAAAFAVGATVLLFLSLILMAFAYDYDSSHAVSAFHGGGANAYEEIVGWGFEMLRSGITAAVCFLAGFALLACAIGTVVPRWPAPVLLVSLRERKTFVLCLLVGILASSASSIVAWQKAFDVKANAAVSELADRGFSNELVEPLYDWGEGQFPLGLSATTFVAAAVVLGVSAVLVVMQKHSGVIGSRIGLALMIAATGFGRDKLAETFVTSVPWLVFLAVFLLATLLARMPVYVSPPPVLRVEGSSTPKSVPEASHGRDGRVSKGFAAGTLGCLISFLIYMDLGNFGGTRFVEVRDAVIRARTSVSGNSHTISDQERDDIVKWVHELFIHGLLAGALLGLAVLAILLAFLWQARLDFRLMRSRIALSVLAAVAMGASLHTAATVDRGDPTDALKALSLQWRDTILIKNWADVMLLNGFISGALAAFALGLAAVAVVAWKQSRNPN